jgi:hypothetical protein
MEEGWKTHPKPYCTSTGRIVPLNCPSEECWKEHLVREKRWKYPTLIRLVVAEMRVGRPTSK